MSIRKGKSPSAGSTATPQELSAEAKALDVERVQRIRDSFRSRIETIFPAIHRFWLSSAGDFQGFSWRSLDANTRRPVNDDPNPAPPLTRCPTVSAQALLVLLDLGVTRLGRAKEAG